MSAEGGGGAGLLKSRAEEFARHLRRRLRGLSGAEEENEGSWAEVLPSDAEAYYDNTTPLASPEEELPEPIFVATQNRDGLQRSESSSSEYFDTFEELPRTPPEPVPLKKIPILHLKTEKPISLTNGHTNVIDADLGCSRVHVMPCEEVEPTGESVEGNCNGSKLENNNTWRDGDEVIDRIDKPDFEPVLAHCNGDAISLETHSNVNGDASSDEKEAEVLGNSNCVFCDIEQAKSSFTNINTESVVSQTKEQRSCRSIDNSADKEPDKKLKEDLCLKVPIELSNECSSDTEESVSLKDILQVLKNEISKESEENETLLRKIENANTNDENSQLSCPSIDVNESTSITTDAAKPEDKEEEFDIELKRKNFRRSSSLKCGKTPPGTPGRKKIVRFADVLGLDLADVKTFLDEVPTVPKSAYSDLHLQPDPEPFSPTFTSSYRAVPATPQVKKVLVPLFQQPFLTPNFMDRVVANNVCLESASVSDMNLFAITGVVRVRNVDFHKSVYVRYSINSWRNYSDLQARYIPNSCDGFSDKFSFVLYAHTLTVGQKLEFAVRYHTAGTQFWDSNGGLNYVFECIQQPPPQAFTTPEIPPSPVETWGAFL